MTIYDLGVSKNEAHPLNLGNLIGKAIINNWKIAQMRT